MYLIYGILIAALLIYAQQPFPLAPGCSTMDCQFHGESGTALSMIAYGLVVLILISIFVQKLLLAESGSRQEHQQGEENRFSEEARINAAYWEEKGDPKPIDTENHL